MSVFEFTITLSGFVVALGIARVLGGCADMIRHWRGIDRPGLYCSWFSLLLFLYIGWWVSTFRFSNSVEVSLFQIFLVFHVPVLIFIGTRLIVPVESEFLDIDSRYNEIRTAFLVFIAASTSVAPIVGLLIGKDFSMLYLLLISCLLIALIPQSRRILDNIVSVSCCIIYLAFLVQFRSTVGG